MSVFVVQESIHADHDSRHYTREGAIAVIEAMIREGLSEPGGFELHREEIDDWIRGNELAAEEAQPGRRSTR